MSTTLTPSSWMPPEQRHRHDRVDDVAVLGQLRHPDGLADVGQPDVARPQLDHLVRHAELGGQAPRVRQVLAAGRADRERDAVGVHLAHVQQRQRAVQAAGQDDADGQVGVDPHPDAVLQREPGRAWPPRPDRRSVGVLAQPQQVDVGREGRARAERRPSRGGPGRTSLTGAPTGTSALISDATCRQPSPARPVQRLHAERVAGQVDTPRRPARRSRTRTRRAAG